MQLLTVSRWSPYIVGVLIGILSWISFLISRRPIGVSTAFVRISGLIEKKINKDKVKKMPYYNKFQPKIEWEVMLVIGLLIGSFISSVISGQFEFIILPEFWMIHYGSTYLLRFLTSLIGGILIGFGARWSGGCTSGHGISGTMQLAVSSWIAVISFFIGGIITAHILF